MMSTQRGGTARAVDKVIAEFGILEFVSGDLFGRLPEITPQAIRCHLNWLVANRKLAAYRTQKRTLLYRVQTQDHGFYCTPELIDVMYRLSSWKRKPPKRVTADETRARVAEILARVRAA